ncbi:hypothetical protein V5N11_011191 [Cardamine amara subsp. amara]|uniref:Uncharacterized protein n=1 Tax=Cardamine amara subsp. amara TaxID=228776 RepID=A0ABD1AM18_CARAN
MFMRMTSNRIIFASIVSTFEPGIIVEFIDALDAMRKDNQPIPPRAMITSRKYRTLVTSWIQPLPEEAQLGYEIDYLARLEN